MFFMISCSEQEEIIDPILGTWRMETDLELYMDGNYHIVDEWIFMPTDSGNYRNIVNGIVLIQDTFQWISDGVTYTIDYSSGKLEDNCVKIGTFENQTALWDNEGSKLIALKVEE